LKANVVVAAFEDREEGSVMMFDAMPSLRGWAAGLFLMGLAGAGPQAAAADPHLGLRAGYYSDSEGAFLGLELLARVAPRIYFNPNIEYVFVDDGRLSTWNADFHYDLPMHGSTFVWLGGGLAVVVRDPDGPDNSHTDVGANFLGGVGLRAGGVLPYFQVKALAREGGGELVLAFGVRF